MVTDKMAWVAGLDSASEAAVVVAAVVKWAADDILVVGVRILGHARVFPLALRVLRPLHHQACYARSLPPPSHLRRQCPTRNREL